MMGIESCGNCGIPGCSQSMTGEACFSWRPIECPQCGGALSEIRLNGPEPQRHCYSCNFDFPIDADGNARREVEENGDR